jgi:hypothetical protein
LQNNVIFLQKIKINQRYFAKTSTMQIDCSIPAIHFVDVVPMVAVDENIVNEEVKSSDVKGIKSSKASVK